jgi:hypothetical protein
VIAALYVERGGAYYGLEGVDPWDAERDARTYAGPWPVVAHPPCSSWCQLASVNEARWGSRIGEDGGCFAAALQAVRTYGGVLEHPSESIAWARYGLPDPFRGWWSQSLTDPGLVTEVSQSAYGCLARKRTWLYVVGARVLPELDWRDPDGEAVIGNGINRGECVGRPKLAGAASSATPAAFRDVLISLARAASPLAVPVTAVPGAGRTRGRETSRTAA